MYLSSRKYYPKFCIGKYCRKDYMILNIYSRDTLVSSRKDCAIFRNFPLYRRKDCAIFRNIQLYRRIRYNM